MCRPFFFELYYTISYLHLTHIATTTPAVFYEVLLHIPYCNAVVAMVANDDVLNYVKQPLLDRMVL